MNRYTFVEVAADLDPTLLHDIVYEAYRSSHAWPAVLWLRGIPIDDVTTMLDEAVRDCGIRCAGVEYRIDQDVASAARCARAASVCVTSTPALRPFLAAHPGEVLTVQEALAARATRGCFCVSCLSEARVRPTVPTMQASGLPAVTGA